jgi:hypothetical protein
LWRSHGGAQTHRVRAAIPVIERAHNADAHGVGRPNGERHSLNAANGATMRAKAFISWTRPFATRGEQVLGVKNEAERIGIA